jgi:putative phage-type endonuclease
MKTVSLIQGSPEWLAHRAKTRNASDAPAMMGASPYVSRSELVKRYATGIQPDIDAATQRIFERGHAVEPALRKLAENIIGDDLYPITGISDDGYLGASFDGVTMDETVIAEFKQTNARKVEDVAAGVIPAADYWQIVQQFAVCESAERCLYMVGDGEIDVAVMHIQRETIEHDIPKLRAGWAQFDADVAAYVPEPVSVAPVATPVAGFGALSLRVEGRVLASNLDSFRADAEAFIARLPKPADLQDDQDFADAESAVKACSEAESRIKAAKDAALAQMSDVDAVLRAADEVAETIRAARLALDKAVKAEKESRKAALVRAGADAVRKHYASINATLGEYAIGAPASLQADIAASIKGLKSLASMRDKIDAAVAQAKIGASQEADRRRLSIAVVEQYAEHRGLLPDAAALVATKSPDDLRNLIAARIAEHEAREAARIEAERERIRAEEAAKLEREEERKRHLLSGSCPKADLVGSEQQSEPPAHVAQMDEHPTSIRANAGSSPAVGATVRLGQINAAIAPLSITADGLAQIGFKSIGKDRAAVLFAGDDFDRIRAALIERLTAARIASIPEAA